MKQPEPVKPVVVVKIRSSARYCGVCGTRVYFRDSICPECETPIDWSEYERNRYYGQTHQRRVKYEQIH